MLFGVKVSRKQRNSDLDVDLVKFAVLDVKKAKLDVHVLQLLEKVDEREGIRAKVLALVSGFPRARNLLQVPQ
jgi:hypothetical protein